MLFRASANRRTEARSNNGQLGVPRLGIETVDTEITEATTRRHIWVLLVSESRPSTPRLPSGQLCAALPRRTPSGAIADSTDERLDESHLLALALTQVREISVVGCWIASLSEATVPVV
jgi:hypothetical protein